MQTATDLELVDAFCRQDKRSALGILYTRYGHLVVGLCLDYLKEREAARDATTSPLKLFAAGYSIPAVIIVSTCYASKYEKESERRKFLYRRLWNPERKNVLLAKRG